MEYDKPGYEGVFFTKPEIYAQICLIMERSSISATHRCTNSMAQQPGSIGQIKRPQTTALVCSKDNRKLNNISVYSSSLVVQDWRQQ